MQSFEEILAYQFGANTIKSYLLALLFFLVLLLIFKIFRIFVIKHLKKLAKKTKNVFDDEVLNIVEGIPSYFYYVISFYFPLKYISTSDIFVKWARAFFIIVVVYQVIKSLQRFVDFVISNHIEKQRDSGAEFTMHGLSLIAGIAIWISGALLVLSNLGVNINSLIASLGIGGIAVALALQNILGDMFSSFSIYFDKPFKVGDFIVVGEYEGTVKRIGLKTTRLETLHGEELVLANNDLTNARVQNFKKMRKRRVVMNLGFVYDTPSTKLRKVNDIVKKAIDSVEGVEFARSHFKEFGDFSLNFEVCYYVLSNDYNVYLDKHQEINFDVKDALEKAKIEIAFPTQTLHLEK